MALYTYFLSCPVPFAFSVLFPFFFKGLLGSGRRERCEAATCVCQTLFLRAVHVQGAIPLTSSGWPPKRRLVRAANVPAQATPTPMVLPPRFCCFHGGFHAIPLNLPRRVAAEPLVKQLLNIPSALTPSPCRSLVPFTVDWMSL